jgi:recombination protein RecA
VRIDIRKVTTIKDGDETVGARIKARVVKNKVAPPYRQAEFDLMHDYGISREGDLLDLGVEDKILQKSGANIYYGDMKLGNGRDNAKQYLRDNQALMDEIGRKVLEKHGLATPAGAVDNGQAADAATKAEQAKPEPTGRRRQSAATD